MQDGRTCIQDGKRPGRFDVRRLWKRYQKTGYAGRAMGRPGDYMTEAQMRLATEAHRMQPEVRTTKELKKITRHATVGHAGHWKRTAWQWHRLQNPRGKNGFCTNGRVPTPYDILTGMP